MSERVTIYHDKFDGGIVNDPRSRKYGAVRMSTNFDLLTNQKRATPYRNSEDGNSSQSDLKIQNFCVAIRTGTTYSLYGLGVTTGGAIGEVYYKDLTTGASNDLDDATWTETANNADAGGSVNFNLFVYYAKRDRIFLAVGGTTISSYDPDGSSAFDDESHALAYTNIAQGLVHSKDDILYIPYDNIIAKNNNNSWTDAAITLPSHLYITSICEFGNYLAIFAAPLSGVGSSVCYLWDRDSTVATLSESIDWGEGVVKVGEEIGGVLCGITLSGNNSTRFKDRVLLKYWDGGARAILIPDGELEGGTTTQLTLAKQKINNRVYFMMTVTLNGAVREGVWSLGRNNDGVFTLIHERTPNNDTALSSGVLKNFFFVGDYLFQSYVDNGANAMSKTNDTSSYTSSTSIIETVINPAMPDKYIGVTKKGFSIGATYAPLPTAGQVIVKAKVNGAAGGYTTIFTETTDSLVRTQPVPMPSGGTHLTDGEEIEFRIESTGGAEVTGLIYSFVPVLSN